MSQPTHDFKHLWNDMSFDERKRLMPYMLEYQKLQIWQCKMKAVKSHNELMAEFDGRIKLLDKELNDYKEN